MVLHHCMCAVDGEGGEVLSPRYHLLPADLRNLSSLEAAVKRAGFLPRCVERDAGLGVSHQ
jgi:hypothetical protein